MSESLNNADIYDISGKEAIPQQVPHEQVQDLVSAGTHSFPQGKITVDAPEGGRYEIDAADAKDAFDQGYTYVSPKTEKYESTKQQTGTLIESGLRAATLGASTAIESGLSKIPGLEELSPEAQSARREVNPGTSTVGEIGGLLATSGFGAGAIMENIGAKAISGLAPTTAIGKIGTAAAKAAVENLVYQTGDETAKYFMNEPQSAESVISNLGLSAVLGGALGAGFGTTKELWSATAGKKVQQILDATEHTTAGAEGIPLSPELMGALNPEGKAAAQDLMISKPEVLGPQIEKLKSDISNSAMENLGKSSSDIEGLANISKADQGAEIQNKLVDNLKQKVDPISEKYNKFTEKFKSIELGEADKAAIQDKISEAAINEGWAQFPKSEANKIVQETLENLQHQKNINDLNNYVRNLKSENPFGSQGYQTAKKIGNLIEDLRDAAVESHIGIESPELLSAFKQTKSEYAQVKGLMSDLNDALRSGKQYGVESFSKNIAEMSPEDVVRRLSTKGDVKLQNLLSEHFPEVLQSVNNQELNNILKQSLNKSKDGIDINKLSNLLKDVDKLNPELRDALINKGAQDNIHKLAELHNQIPTSKNPSGSAKAFLDLMGPMKTAAAIAVGGVHGGLALLGNLFAKAGLDAVKLAHLKFLGAGVSTDAVAFKHMVEFASAVTKGESSLANGVKNIFSKGTAIATTLSNAERDKLDTHLQQLREHPEKMLSLGGKLGHYMPDHAIAMSSSVSNITNYLQALKPNTVPKNPLDPKPVISTEAKAEYNRALDIANNPMVVLDKMAKGIMSSKDVIHLRNMYPSLYNRIGSKLTEEVTDRLHKELPITHQQKQMMSLFLGQPMDSTLTTPVLQSIQMGFAAQNNPPQQMPHSMKSLDKLPAMYQTPLQARASRQR
jgi:hypothetical protein